MLAFFIGGVLYVVLEYASTRILSSRTSSAGDGPTSLGLYIGILVDLVIDGVVIGIGSTLTLATGLLLALGLAISTAPLAFVTTATAKRQGMSAKNRRLLSFLFFLCVLSGALLGYLVLRNQSEELRLILVALASGFLITTVVQRPHLYHEVVVGNLLRQAGRVRVEIGRASCRKECRSRWSPYH